MKNKFLTLIAITALLFTACKKGADVIPLDGGKTNGTYQPFTRDSHWEYRTETEIPGTNDTEVENSVITMTQGLYQMDNKVYHQAKSVTGNQQVNVFYGLNDKVYSIRETDDDTGIDLDIPYLKDDAAAGTTWLTPVNVSGTAVQAQLKTTIQDVGISKTIQGKTYTNVVRSQVEVQYKINNVYQTSLTFKFYVAKGIGMIAIYTTTPAGDLSITELTSYTIK